MRNGSFLVDFTRASIPAALALVTACASSPASDADGNATSELEATSHVTGTAVAAEVRRELDRMRETHYEHQTHVIESDGVFDVDCSGFVDYVLNRVASAQFSTVVTASDTTRPLAEDYVRFFGGLSSSRSIGWTSIARAEDLTEGDLVAWLEPAGALDTGHVMVVRGTPKRRDDESFLVPVWDSVELPHGPGDSRASTSSTGIGYGDVVLLVNSDGAPIGHEWSDGGTRVLERTTLGHLR